MKIVIMAGGRGTRIAKINSELPKPMLPVCGKPVIEYQIESIRKQGYTDFVIIVGYRGNAIIDYFGNGQKFGVFVQYIIEKEPLGTAGALYYLKNELTEDFLLINGDIIFDIDINRMYQFHKQCNGTATIFTHPNNHPYDSGIIITDNMNCVRDWLYKEDRREWYKNRVNAGIHMLSPDIFSDKYDFFNKAEKVDLDREILKRLIEAGELYAYDSTEYVKDMGTLQRYEIVEKDVVIGKVQERNIKNKQKAIFLDRDGTINQYIGFLKNIDDFKLMPQVGKAIKIMNLLGYLVIVVTNQPVIARGELSEGQLRMIHNKMETLLGNEGAYIDAIYYCPHHPDKGFEGEREELKIDCSCRKPKPGMLLEAAEKYNIDLRKSWMVGDGKNDILAGNSAGCKTALIGKRTEDCGQTITVDSLFEFSTLLRKEGNI